MEELNHTYESHNIEYPPFSITFSFEDKHISLQLMNGEDIFKLADLFSEVLTKNNIEHKITKQ